MHLLRGIARLHSCGIACTGIFATQAIDTWITEHPPRTYASLSKMVSAFVSQSFPPPTLDVLSSCKIKLADFSSGMFNKVSEYLFYSQLIFMFSPVCIRSDHWQYHPLKLAASRSRVGRQSERICRHLDLWLPGELFFICCDTTSLTCQYARCSRFLPITLSLNLWYRLSMMRQKLTCYFFK